MGGPWVLWGLWRELHPGNRRSGAPVRLRDGSFTSFLGNVLLRCPEHRPRLSICAPLVWIYAIPVYDIRSLNLKKLVPKMRPAGVDSWGKGVAGCGYCNWSEIVGRIEAKGSNKNNPHNQRETHQCRTMFADNDTNNENDHNTNDSRNVLPPSALADAYAVARMDPAFSEELAWYRREYIGGPTPLHFARRLTESTGGAQVLMNIRSLGLRRALKVRRDLNVICEHEAPKLVNYTLERLSDAVIMPVCACVF